ncbi:MAG TPA: 30S ribosomal protein S6 [Acidimicrobiales bacterium]|nr:30S ribosomal protein S6 [Acidimicrobiales bacterium]
MRPYEIAIIFDATLDEQAIRETIERVVELVSARGGRPGRIDRWGRRPFAYEMKHRSEGYYVFVEVSAQPATVAEVDRFLSLSDDVLRHRVIRQPEHRVARPATSPEPEAAQAR